MRAKLIAIFVGVILIAMSMLVVFSMKVTNRISDHISDVVGSDAIEMMKEISIFHVEHMTTDIAYDIAKFLGQRDQEIRYLATLPPDAQSYRDLASKTLDVAVRGRWKLSDDGSSWIPVDPLPSPSDIPAPDRPLADGASLHARSPEIFSFCPLPLYDEITFIGLDGVERIKVVTKSNKIRYPLSPELRDVSQKENTYVKAEDYFSHLKDMLPGEIYVSNVIGAYTPSQVTGLYTPLTAEGEFLPEQQAYAGMENPNGRRFEGIIRWAAPVADEDGQKIGYVTFAVNYDHLLESIEHRRPEGSRYIALPNAQDGNYNSIWDSMGRSIAHARHSSIFGYDADTGEPYVPQDGQSTYEVIPADGGDPLVSLFKLTHEGGSGSLTLERSGRLTLITAAAIPYYTGIYAKTGFGAVSMTADIGAVGAPSALMRDHIEYEIDQSINVAYVYIVFAACIIVLIMIIVAFMMANWVASRISALIDGMRRFRSGELHFRFDREQRDEFGQIADAFDTMADTVRVNFKNPLTITDIDRRIIHMNDKALELCGSTIDKVVGLPYDTMSIYPSESRFDPIEAFNAGREADVFHLVDDTHDKYMKPLASYMIGANGIPIGYFIESIDITEMHKMSLEVKRAMQEATEASRHKSEFLARMSHEIRTPMNAIIGLTGMIRKKVEAMPPDQSSDLLDSITNIEMSSHHLLNMLNDVLEISKIEMGRLDISEEPAALTSLIDTIDSMIRPRCDEKDINYEQLLDDLDGISVMIDSSRIRQVIINLLINAIKFTPSGGTVQLEVRKREEHEGRLLLHVSVRDTGIGISEYDAERIFEPFEQGEGISSKYGGTGIGLSICRTIVRLMGGEIKLKSIVGEGSEFSFEIWLPIVQTEEQKKILAEDIDGRLVGKKLLLVDDVEINRVIVASMLEDSGVEIAEAADGLEAVEIFRSSEVGEFDMILMDIQMPNMDGHQASLEIRALDRPDASSVSIVALSANAFQDDIDKSIESKMNEHIPKPVEESVLVEAVVRYLLPEGI